MNNAEMNNNNTEEENLQQFWKSSEMVSLREEDSLIAGEAIALYDATTVTLCTGGVVPGRDEIEELAIALRNHGTATGAPVAATVNTLTGHVLAAIDEAEAFASSMASAAVALEAAETTL